MTKQESRTVLIVEDSIEDRETYRRYLLKDERYSYQILETESGKKAYQLCLTTKPDVILLDYFLPDLDGLEFLKELKTRTQQTDLPVVMLTGQGNESVAVAAMKNGAADYLVKGNLTPESFCSAVHTVMERERLKRQLAQSQEQQRLTAAIALRIRQFLNLDEILNTTVTEVQQLLKCDRVVVYQFAPDMSGKIVAESVGEGWKTSLNNQIIDTCFQTGAGEEYRQGKKRAISNIYEAGFSDCHIQFLEQFQVKANLIVPILLRAQTVDLSPKGSPTRRGELDSPLPSEGTGALVRRDGGVRSAEQPQLWGLLIAHQCDNFRQWQNDELNLLDELAVQISISIQQAQLFKQLQQELENRKQTEYLQQRQKQVLEMIATGDTLSQILDTLSRNLEEISRGMLCSILLVNPNGKNLRVGAAPNLPESYNQAVDGLPIGYGVGCCGTAAYLGKPVIVSDIATDPFWANFRDLVLSYNLAACWSWPILSSSGKVLGTLAMYYREPRTPSAKELKLIESAAHIAAIAIEQKLSQAALEKSEKHYKILAELSPVGIFNTDAQGNCLYINQQWCSIAGFTVEEALGSGWSNAIHPDDRENVFKEWYQAAVNNLPFYLEYRFINHQGVTTWVLGQARAVRCDNQEIVGYVGTITDISSRKEIEAELGRRVLERTDQLRASEVRFRAIFNQTFQFISLLKPDGTIIEINQTALDFGGVTLEECVGKPFWETPWWRISTQTQEQLKKAIAIAASGTFIRYEVDVQGANGKVMTIDLSLKPIKDETGKVVLLIPEGRDISERKQAEEKLKIANSELARSNQELENFAYIASHDLQEPLRKIKSFTQLLGEDYREKLDETADKYIHYITDGTTRMQALITDLLSYSRIGRIELNKKPTNLNVILSQVKTDLSVAIEENNAIITATPLPTVSANPVQMAQLLQNLIANSIKFRGETSPKINISAQLQQQKWLISIQDNGIGIKAEYTERIFVIFQRLHNRSKYPGTGIGLAICRKIVERHGGQIWLESELGKGTIFYLTLPV